MNEQYQQQYQQQYPQQQYPQQQYQQQYPQQQYPQQQYRQQYAPQQDYRQQQIPQRKGFHPFYIMPIIFIAFVYLLPLWMQIGNLTGLNSVIWLPIIAGIVNIPIACAFCKPENRQMMFNAVIMIKYGMIPFFVLGGIVVLMCFLMALCPIPFMIILAPLIGGLMVLYGWALMALGSPYVIAYLALTKKAGMRGSGSVALHIIAQFFFVLDVVSAMILTIKEKRWKKLTIGIVIGLGVAILLIILWIVFAVVIAALAS